MTTVSAQIRQGRKFDQVLEGAREVFLEAGFEGASVDDIARAAKVSKATLYSYFPDKRLLFLEVATRECTRQAETALAAINLDDPAPQVLRAAGEHMLAFIQTSLGSSIYRLCVGECLRFPELAQAFYASGPCTVHAELSRFLTLAVERGELVIEDIPLAADQFAELVKADMFAKLVFGVQTEFSKAERDRIIDGAVQMFMARYANPDI